MIDDRDDKLVLTGGADIAREAYFFYADQLLGYGPELRLLFEAADAEPDCGLLNAHAAALHLAFEGREGWALAAPYLANMRAVIAKLTPREQLFCAGVEAWAAQDFARAQDLFTQMVRRWPNDLVAVKWAQYHAFNLGDQPALLDLGALALQALPGDKYVHGLVAFGLEQNHLLVEAEHHAMKAAEIAIDDAWAHHAVAHVMETTGRAAEGATWLSHCDHIWDAKGTFIREHNWWHAALFQLTLGDHARVLEIFDEKLWGEWPEFPQEQIGAASMLWRLELQGVDVGERWGPIAIQARARIGDHLYPFHDLHYLFALVRGGAWQEAISHREAMAECLTSLAPARAKTWAQAALPAADGILAFAKQDYTAAQRHLTTAKTHLEKIGGSHAQRGIFDATLRAAETALSGRSVAL